MGKYPCLWFSLDTLDANDNNLDYGYLHLKILWRIRETADAPSSRRLAIEGRPPSYRKSVEIMAKN
ncbi:MAG: hypothetical protein H7325_06395 [Pedobacter sp.]|nr:hypothetical protein [Pedobacter sp.]